MCTPEKVKEVRHWIGATLADNAVHTDVINAILLAASEAVTNSIMHAYKPKREGRVDVTLRFLNNVVQVSVRDYGSGMNMEHYDTPDITIASEGGYGIYLIQTLMSDVRLVPHTDGTELVMCIALKHESAL